MKAQEQTPPLIVGTYVRLDEDTDNRLDRLSICRGMKAHIMRTGIRKEIEYLENLKRLQLQQEQKAS
jgi:predicted DNA-binding protein